MLGLDRAVWTPLLHRRRILRHAEAKQTGRLPYFDGLHKSAGRKLAVASRADARAVDARALGVGLLSGGYGREELERAGAFRVYDDPADLLIHLDELGVRVPPTPG